MIFEGANGARDRAVALPFGLARRQTWRCNERKFDNIGSFAMTRHPACPDMRILR